MACSISRYKPWERWEIEALHRIIIKQQGNYSEVAALTGRSTTQCYNAGARYGTAGQAKKGNQKTDAQWAKIDFLIRQYVECDRMTTPQIVKRLRSLGHYACYHSVKKRIMKMGKEVQYWSRKNTQDAQIRNAMRNLKKANDAHSTVRHRDNGNSQAPSCQGLSAAAYH